MNLKDVSENAFNLFEWQRAVRDAPKYDPRAARNPRHALTPYAKLALYTLATYASGDGGNAIPSAETIGSKVGRSARRVRDDLTLAEEAGYFVRRRRNRQKTYRYQLTLPVARPDDDVPTRYSPNGRPCPFPSGHGRPDNDSEEQTRRERPSGSLSETLYVESDSGDPAIPRFDGPMTRDEAERLVADYHARGVYAGVTEEGF